MTGAAESAEGTLRTQRLFGLDFVSDATIAEVADRVVEEARIGSPNWRCVVTPNVDHLVRYEREPDEAEAGRAATIVLPDGAPIVWASRLLRRPLHSRLTGADLFDALWLEIIAARINTVVVASSEPMASLLTEGRPWVRCVVAPRLDVTNRGAFELLACEVDAAVSETGAALVVVAIAMPKHHRLANALRQGWSGAGSQQVRPVVLLLGAAPEFTLGLTPRAPGWMRRTGTEWLHRLIEDPRRMARRYLVDDPRFAVLVWREFRRQRPASTAEGGPGGQRGRDEHH